MIQRLRGTLPRTARVLLVAAICLLVPGCSDNYECEFSGIIYGTDPVYGPYIQGTATCYVYPSYGDAQQVVCNGRYYTDTGQLEGTCQ